MVSKKNINKKKKGKGIKKIIKKVSNKTSDIIENLKDYGKAIIYGREDYPPKVRNIINIVGDKYVKKITIKRTPVSSVLTGALTLFSSKFGERLERDFDELFHLFIELTLDDNTTVSLEKNEVINMDINPKTRPKTEIKIINTPIPNITLNEMLNNTENYMGKKKYFSYSAKNNNCQDYILSFLKSNNIGDENDYAFVKQDTKSLFENLPYLRKLSNTVTTIGERINVITTGAGIDYTKNYIVQSVIFDKDKYSISSARKWLKENNYVFNSKVDKQLNVLRFRQVDPLTIENKGFTDYKVKPLGDSGIQLILSYKNKISNNNIGNMQHCEMCGKKMKGGKIKVNIKGTILDRRFKTPAELRQDFGINAIEKAGNKISKGTKSAAKSVANYVTSTDQGGLSDDLLKYGLPAVTGSLLGGIAGAATLGNPAAIIPATAIGSKLGAVAGNQTSKKVIGNGMRKSRFKKGSQEAKDYMAKIREMKKK